MGKQANQDRRLVWHELVTPRRIIFGGIALIVAGFLYALGADAYEAIKSWSSSPNFDWRMLLFTVLVLLGVITIAYGARVMKKRSQTIGVEIGGKYFDSSLYVTEELGHLGLLLAKPVKSLWVMGISLHQFAVTHRGAIDKLLANGIIIRFLLHSSGKSELKESDLVKTYVMAAGSSRTRTNIVESFDELKKLHTKYGEKLQVRQHDLLPFHSMIIVDDSFIQVGFYLYSTELRKAGPSDRPQAVVSKLLHPEIFKCLLNSYEAAWEMAEPI